ncbi:uncharacterized protein TrAFT101_009083 [Trichoderma asperellum]|uniref:uncharacterized protein n=1 Tax=Trichoderma asperellum TaxID=101201 RepID=UPI00332E6446|nr:hypothetical protein TrAFT101_009083 [Trichoderma asperellum]
MENQRNPAEAQRRKVTTYGKLASRKRHTGAGPTSSLLQVSSTETSSSATSATHRPKQPQPSPLQTDDSSRPQKTLSSARHIALDAARKQQASETDTTRKRSHKSAFGTGNPVAAIDVVAARRLSRPSSAQEQIRHSDGADVKDTKPNAVKNGSVYSKSTTSLPATPKRSSAVELAAIGLEKDIEAKILYGNKSPETPPTRRRRLIDALVAEKTSDPSASPSQSVPVFEHINRTEHKAPDGRPSIRKDAPLRRTASDTTTLEKRKIKFTYSQSRSILQDSQESNATEPTDFPSIDDIDEPLKPPSPTIEEDDDDDDELKTKVAIRSVHELRRAGANNRSSDEVDDLLSRIGAPGSLASTMRRNALCELADKLQNKEFMNQFRDHASRDNIAKGISKEKDTISGFLLAAAFVIFLSSGPAPHMLHQLTENKVGAWLSNLLNIQEDINAIATQKSSNMPKTTRNSLASVKKTLLEMPLWHGYQLLHLSPQTIALQLLSMLVGLLDPQEVQAILDDTATSISELRSHFASLDSRNDVNYALTIRILEAQSSSLTSTNDTFAQVQQEMSEIATFLRSMLQDWPKTHNDIDATLLKLAINTTNNETRAAAIQTPQLLSSLTRCIISGFSAVESAIQKSTFESNIYDELLLILGIMINVLEHSSDARISIDADEINQLISTWSELERVMEKDDSVETSKLGIAYSYLAIILGYSYLGHPELPVTNGLLPAIQHFITIYKTVNHKTVELESLVHSLSGRSC